MSKTFAPLRSAGCHAALSANCHGWGSMSSPICEPCWMNSTVEQKETVKNKYNELCTHPKLPYGDSHIFCAKKYCWETVPKKHWDTGFCSTFNRTGVCLKHAELMGMFEDSYRPPGMVQPTTSTEILIRSRPARLPHPHASRSRSRPRSSTAGPSTDTGSSPAGAQH